MLPYKIHTPQQFPFVYNGTRTADTLFIYDSNYPSISDSNHYFLVNSSGYGIPRDSARNVNYDAAPTRVSKLSFNQPQIRNNTLTKNSYFKKANLSNEDSLTDFAIGNNDYSIISSGVTEVTSNINGYTDNSVNVIPVIPNEQGIFLPRFFSIDTNHSATVVATNYSDSGMYFHLDNNLVQIGINRIALPGQTDYATFSNKKITYGTHDNVTKLLMCYQTQASTDLVKGTDMLVTNLTATPNDSFVTEIPKPFNYKITKIVGPASTYSITVTAMYNDTAKTFTATNITLPAHSSHTIDPYFIGPKGPQVVILEDVGNIGVIHDTMFITKLSSPIVVPNPDERIEIYPNPAEDRISVSFGQLADKNFTVTISDIAGKVVQLATVSSTHHVSTIPLTDFARGSYIIRITDNTGRQVFSDKFLRK